MYYIFQESLKSISSKLETLTDAGIDVVAVSADTKEVAQKCIDENTDLRNVQIGTDLKEETMRQLGLYVSDPTAYIPQTHRFAEPGYFFLNSDNTIRYIDISSSPIGGRPNIDVLLMVHGYVTQRAAQEPEFKRVVWGSV